MTDDEGRLEKNHENQKEVTKDKTLTEIHPLYQ
jgi:hypothetical protein